MAEALDDRWGDPPAAMDAGSAAAMGEALVARFDHIAPLPDKAAWVDRWVARDLGGVPVSGPAAVLARACSAVAAAVDAQADAFDRLGYHNRQHFCEVVLSAHALCRLEGLDADTIRLVVLAAWIHDLVHDGQPHPPFVLERASVARAVPMLSAAGVGAAHLGQLTTLVLATDFGVGADFVAATCASEATGRARPAVPPGAPELSALRAEAGRLAPLARLLCEADILPSIGLTPAHALRLQARLAEESHRPLGDDDKLAFVDAVLARGGVGRHFLPNVLRLRDALDHRCRARPQR